MKHLASQRILIPGSQVSSLTTGNITLTGARGAFIPPTAFESISTVQSNGSSADLVFTAIPQTYEYLQVRIFLRTDDASPLLKFRLNGDTSSQYSYARMAGFESYFAQSYDASTYDALSYVVLNYHVANNTTPNLIGTRLAIIDLYDYANPSKFTGVRSVYGAHGSVLSTPSSTGINYGQYSETTPITSITLTTGNATAFDGNSYACLYGIKGS